ncbi:MAG: HIT domain-containing protein [Fidelibacterota bacterium]
MSELSKLWAPWRIEYIRAPRETECIFCVKSQDDNDRDNLVLYKGKQAFILMNLFPYNNGHLMIAPYKHVETTRKLDRDCLQEIMILADLSMEVIEREMRAQGFNFGANIGSVAGAGIEEHIHFHLVPRWTGDTNFMPVIGHSKIQVEGLQECYDNLKPHFDKFQIGE